MTRLHQVQDQLQDYQVDALLVTNAYNLRYVANFTGTTGLAVITEDKAFFVTDFRYTEQASAQVQDFEVIQNKGPIFEEVANLIDKEKIERLGFEKHDISFAQYQEMNELFQSALIPRAGIIESLRQVKDSKEVETIEAAIGLTEKAYQHILNYIQVGMTEIQVANELEAYLKRLGATSMSFDTIVASGYRSAMPHGVASDKKIQNNELITIDFGCYYQGYASDITRTFAIGDPGEELKEIYEIVKEAQALVHQKARPGITGRELDQVARDYIGQKGYGEQFGHSTGHGLGLEVHEGPTVSYRNEEALIAGNVITNEPGIYLPGLGGVRIEDDLLITDQGSRNLVSLPKDLIIL